MFNPSENSVSAPTLICPECGSGLERSSADDLRCLACRCIFPSQGGVICLAKTRDFYFGEQDAEQMNQALSLIKTYGFTEGFQRFLDKLSPDNAAYMAHYVLGEDRLGFLPLVPRGNSLRALDIGAGWGALALPLSFRYGHVTAMDLTPHRLLALRHRANEYHRTNMSLILGGDRPRLPFANEQFDLVLLIGVLEYAGTSGALSPSESQQNMLAEVRRVLKSDGTAVVGIENRFALKYFCGAPEDHTGIRFLSLYPRPLAHVVSRLKGKRFNIYTYGMGGYRALMARAGFPQTYFFSPRPDYRFIESILPASEFDWVSEDWAKADFFPHPSRRIERDVIKVLGPAFAGVGLGPRLAGSYFVVGTKSLSYQPPLREIIGRLSEAQSEKFRLEKYTVSATGDVLFHVASSNERKAVGRIALTVDKAQRLTKAYDCRVMLVEHPRLDDRSKFLIPKVLLAGRQAGDHFWVEEFRSGRPGSASLLRGELLGRIADFLIDTQNVTSKLVRLEGRVLEALLSALAPESPRLSRIGEYGVIAQRLRDCLTDAIWPLVLCHGDLWHGNCLVSSQGVVNAIIDWEFTVAEGLAGFDFVHFLTILRIERTGEQWGGYGHSFDHFVGEFSREEREIIARYWALAGLSKKPEAWPALQAFVWMAELNELHAMMSGRSTRSWEDVVRPSDGRVAQLLDSYLRSRGQGQIQQS